MISGESQLYTTHPIVAKDKIKYLQKFWKSSYSLPNHRLKSYDYYYDKFISSEIKDIINTGIKPTYNITLENGKSLRCTLDTKFLTTYGFHKLEEDLEVGTTELISCCNKPKYSKIKSIVFFGEEETYKVNTYDNYIVNGIVIQ